MTPPVRNAIQRLRACSPAPGRLQGMKCMLLAALLFCTPAFSMAEELASEYQVKAAFLYNFSRFTSWPEEAATGAAGFHICLAGSDPFGGALESLTGKMVRNRPLVIHRAGTATLTEDCQMVFVSNSEAGRIDELLAGLRHKPVLTVSDADDFTRQGGIIQLRLVDRKIRFEINVDAAERAGLNISSKLLSLATVVHDEKAGMAP